MSILDAIGNTSIVELRRVVPNGCGRVFVKCEWENPTGSMKDRMAIGAIRRAQEDGRLKPGEAVVEYTGGSTGASLGLVCGALGHPLHIVTSDAFSLEKRNQIRAYGAELTLVPSEGGLSTKKLFLEMIDTARNISKDQGAYWFNQLENADTIAGYHSLGEEIWNQTNGKVDAFVHAIGTGASSRGVATLLKRHRSDIKIFGVEPGESAVLSGGEPGGHMIEGIGIGYPPPLYDSSLFNEIIPVTTPEAMAMARRLAREESIFAGTSSGANAVAALRIAERLGPDATVVTLMIDSGLKYLNTDLYRF